MEITIGIITLIMVLTLYGYKKSIDNLIERIEVIEERLGIDEEIDYVL